MDHAPDIDDYVMLSIGASNFATCSGRGYEQLIAQSDAAPYPARQAGHKRCVSARIDPKEAEPMSTNTDPRRNWFATGG